MTTRFLRKPAPIKPSPTPIQHSKARPNFSMSNKKATLQPLPQNVQSQDDNAEPMIDLPTPPVQIVSYRHGQPGEMISLPSLTTAPHGEIPQLAFQKIKQCNRICDFSDPSADAKSKQIKKDTLHELIDCYSSPKMFSKLTRECHQALIEMFAANVFRPMPYIPRALLISDDVSIEDTAWPHLSLVYILFLKFLDCQVDPRILQFQLTPRFIQNIFAVLDFPDERERGQAKAVISAIFNKVPPQRPLLRLVILNLLMGVPEGLQMNAASHLLDLLNLLTANIPIPLAPQHIYAFEKVLLPLHLPDRCRRYFPSLQRLTLLMIRKDARLGSSLLDFLTSHWPLTLDHKSELFIDEISQMIDEGLPKNLNEHIPRLFNCICIAMESQCMTLADKALKFLQNNRIQNAVKDNPVELMTLIFPSLYRVAGMHWQRTVQISALGVMNSLLDLNPEAFRTVAEGFKTQTIDEPYVNQAKKNKWSQLVEVASMNDSSIAADTITNELNQFFGQQRKHKRRKIPSQLQAKSRPVVGSLPTFQENEPPSKPTALLYRNSSMQPSPVTTPQLAQSLPKKTSQLPKPAPMAPEPMAVTQPLTVNSSFGEFEIIQEED